MFGLVTLSLLSACGAEDPSQTDGSPWDLNEWNLVEPTPEPADMTPVVSDMLPSEDMGPPVEEDMGPVDLGQPDFGEPDFGEPDFGEPDLGPEGLTTGAPCETNDECIGGSCLPDQSPVIWEGSYCSRVECDDDLACSQSGGSCINDSVLDGTPFCAQPCNPNPQPGFSSCREGYDCRAADQDTSGDTFCLPTRDPVSVAVNDGEACSADTDCEGGTCIPDEDGWPQGYCTTMNCQNRRDCATEGVDNRCYQNPQGPNFCVRMCQSTSDCRTNYVCQPVGGGQGFCVPDPSEPLTLDPATYPIALTCGAPTNPQQQSHTFDYTISPQTTAYMVTTLAMDGQQIAADTTALPNNTTINYFQGGNSYQNTTAQIFKFVSPIPTPAKPEFANQLQAGTHQHTIYAESQNVCHYVLEESTPGTTIDLNIYLVGVPNITAAQAPTNTNLQATLAAFSNIYTAANISLGTVRYFDITGADAQSYRVIRTEDDISELVALSQVPGQTADDALSLNVFFVRNISLGGGTIGISQGLPGPAGIHGTGASGVVFTSEFLGQTFNDPSSGQTNGNEYTGVVMAHELGHYLGLFHTTEQFAQGQDPLTDTPVCGRNQFPDNCPDLDNLMFPLAGVTHTDVTPNQSYVIGVNPLTKD